jgi:hypothetical protein
VNGDEPDAKKRQIREVRDFNSLNHESQLLNILYIDLFFALLERYVVFVRGI